MISKYSKEILHLEQSSHGLFIGLPLLLLSNFALCFMSLRSASWSLPKLISLAFFPGSMFSLWQLQILHDALHGSLPKPSSSSPSSSPASKFILKHRKALHQRILFWGSMPSAFGYYLYLFFGHLTHHKSFGDPSKVSLKNLFNSNKKTLKMEMFKILRKLIQV
jgi:hypothetical protein